jgi:hypothetical protein
MTAARIQRGARAMVTAVSFQESTNMRYRTMHALSKHYSRALNGTLLRAWQVRMCIRACQRVSVYSGCVDKGRREVGGST